MEISEITGLNTEYYYLKNSSSCFCQSTEIRFNQQEIPIVSDYL